jgi:hypothetical protein
VRIYLAVLLLLAARTPALAAGATVQQLADLVSAAQAHGEPDKKFAQKLAGLELRQRLTDGTLAQLLPQAPGPLTRDALQTLADESTFLDPPSAELPDAPAPTPAEQKTSLEKARNYTIGYIEKLPNFLCTLIVRRFDNGRTAAVSTGQPATDTSNTASFRLRDTVSGDLTFISGKEATKVRTVNGVPSNGQLTRGLRTHDEVGGLLSSLFSGDTPPPFVWSHWENVAERRLAVFRYSLDKAHSHFTVSYCCQPGVVNVPTTIPTAAIGEISIDPASGIVFRITEQAVNIRAGFPIQKAAIMVEYAAVPIGKKSFICPVRSISVTDLEVLGPSDFFARSSVD